MYIDRRIDPYEDETDRDSICPTYVNWPINKTVIENLKTEESKLQLLKTKTNLMLLRMTLSSSVL